jgi:hypothetical protein
MFSTYFVDKHPDNNTIDYNSTNIDLIDHNF